MQKKYSYVLGTIMILGSVFLATGCDPSEDSSDDLVGNWKRSGDFDGPGRSEAVTFTIGDSVYITTGTTERDIFKDLWVYSLSRQYWAQRADLLGPARNRAVGFAANGKGYVGTGHDGNIKLNDFYEYDPATNSWTRKADFTGSARYDATGFSLDNKGYVTCGYDGNWLKDLYQYNPLSDTWSQKASLGGLGGGSKRSEAMVFILSNKAYIFSGTNNGTSLNDLWMYDGVTDTWVEKRKITDVSEDNYDDDYASIKRHNGVAFTMGNYGFVTCGEDNSYINTTWQYDADNDLWTEKTGFEGSVRVGAVAFTLNNRGFVLTGQNGSLSFDNMYEFDPSAEQNDNDN